MDITESLEEQTAFFRSAHGRFLEARSLAGGIDFDFELCGTTVRLSFAGEALVPQITPALTHLRIDKAQAPDLTICLWDSESTATSMVRSPWRREQFTDRGDIWGYYSTRIKIAFHYSEFSLNMLDMDTNTGLFWIERAQNLPSWVKASPLRTLLHWWMEMNGCQFIHAAAVGTKNGAVLLTGKGGIGKSTTALSCLKSGLFYVGDDFVVTGLKPEPSVYSLYSTAKLNADHAMRFPELTGLISRSEESTGEKAVMFLYPEFNTQIVNSMPLKAIVVPHVADNGESRITRTSLENVLRAASFTTMTLLPGASMKTYEFLNQLSASLPCFSLELGQDLTHIPKVISDLLEDLSYGKATNSIYAADAESAERHNASKAWPALSVVVPVFNGEQFIREAVENIISQDYPSLEIIVVDDGSTDNTADIITQFPYEIRYFKQGNSGPAAARNRGIKEAQGDYIAFLDVDDLWPKNNLFMLVKELSSDNDIEVVHGYAQLAFLNPAGHTYEYSGSPIGSFPYYVGAALYRRAAFTRVGLFDPTLRYGEDTDWFLRAQELKTGIKRLEDITLIVRRHGKNMTYIKDAVELSQLRVFKKSLERMRERKCTGGISP